jgi:hypothetical protein
VAEIARPFLLMVAGTAAVLLATGTVDADGGFALPNPFAQFLGEARHSSPPPTDAEREMSDRIWRFVFAPVARGWFTTRTPAQARAGLLTGQGGPMAVGLYYDWLHRTAYASSGARYASIADDVEADLATIPDAFASICRVTGLDRQRAVALDNLPAMGAEAGDVTQARKAENAKQVGWFVYSLHYRRQAYAYALDRLLVDGPDPKAMIVDADLALLGTQVAAAERHEFCAGSVRPGSPHRSEPMAPSRFVHGNPVTASGAPPGS